MGTYNNNTATNKKWETGEKREHIPLKKPVEVDS